MPGFLLFSLLFDQRQDLGDVRVVRISFCLKLCFCTVRVKYFEGRSTIGSFRGFGIKRHEYTTFLTVNCDSEKSLLAKRVFPVAFPTMTRPGARQARAAAQNLGVQSRMGQFPGQRLRRVLLRDNKFEYHIAVVRSRFGGRLQGTMRTEEGCVRIDICS